jgi:alpha-beta hydrolase superfamily lysophospholipase
MSFRRLAIISCVAGLAACSIPKPSSFYDQPATAAPPGTLIGVQPYDPTIPGAAAYRILYDSTDEHGAAIPVSGVVYVPTAPPPPGGRNVVSWAHPTTGAAPGCAPSLNFERTGGISLADSIPGLPAFIAAGDIVAATDYPGLGTPEPHPYLIGKEEAYSIIDAARAARHLPGADASGKYAAWGHSQGAQAVMFVGQVSKQYAPDMTLVGVAAAAPPSDLLRELTVPFDGPSGRLFGAYVYETWSQIYQVPITSVVDPRAIANVHKAAAKCISAAGEIIAAGLAAHALNPVFLDHPPESTPPRPALFTENSPGHSPAEAPILIIQGTADTTVQPQYTHAFVRKLCSQHATLDYQELNGVSHLVTANKGLPLTIPWIASRFTGTKAPDNCKG